MNTAGDADLSVIGRLMGEPARARVLMALSDGGPERAPGQRPGGAVLDPVAYAVTGKGSAWLTEKLGLPDKPYSAVRGCVDWTEQRHHLAGQLGRDMLAACAEHGWIKAAGPPRALLLTPAGREALEEALQVDLAQMTGG